jgi:hypothetical protein
MKSYALVLTSFCTIAITAHHASAEPGSYVAGGGDVGFQLGFMGAMTVDAGVRLARSPVIVHGAVARGQFSDLNEAVGSNSDTGFIHGSGMFVQARAGLELEQCTTSGVFCGLAGADLGVLRSGTTDGPFSMTPSVRYTQEQIIPRVGLDVGGAHLRLRVTFDITGGLTQRSAPQPGSEQGVQGYALGTAVAYRF